MKIALSPAPTGEELATLRVWSSDAANPKRALRAAIILAVAADDSCATCTIVQERLRGLDDRPRSGTPRRIDPERIAQVVQRSLEPTPRDARAWSRRTLAHATGVSRSTVHRIWNTLDLAPHRHTPAQ
jgi:Homeodomain-like domain